MNFRLLAAISLLFYANINFSSTYRLTARSTVANQHNKHCRNKERIPLLEAIAETFSNYRSQVEGSEKILTYLSLR